jgi:hypothetical protein
MKQLRRPTVMLLVGGFVAACSNADSVIAPRPTASLAKGAGGGGAGGGGGGTAVPPTPVPTLKPTIAVTSPSTSVFIGQEVAVFVTAVSEGNTRTAPVLTVAGAPDGFVQRNIVVIDNPHGGGPGNVQATYVWTPTRAQLGVSARITFTATTSGGSVAATATLPAVQDAPEAVTGLTATVAVDHIEAHWQPSIGGTGTVSYDISACYRNANIRPSAATCDAIATTTSTSALNLPLVNPSPTVAPSGGIATYFHIIVTARDANGVQSAPVGVDVQ